MTHDVFISYSNKDKPIADAICANLEAGGIRCWIAPRDITPGLDWPTAIANAISASRLMVLVFSANSNSSNEVGRELILAANKNLIIIPFKIDNIAPEPGKEYYLARTHWLDAVNPPTQEQIDQLLGYARSFMAVQASPATTQPATETGSPGKEMIQPPTRVTPAPSWRSKSGWKRKWLWGIPIVTAIVAGSTFFIQFFDLISKPVSPTITPAPVLSPIAVSPTVMHPLSTVPPTATVTLQATSTITAPTAVNTVGANIWTGIGPTGRWITALAIDPKTPATLYAGTDDGLYKSTDSGGNWSKVGTGLTDPAIYALAIDPVNPTTLYAGTGNQLTNKKIVGVFKSTDGGANWSASNAGLPDATMRVIAVDPLTPGTLYAGGAGVFKSTDGGVNWKETWPGSDIRALVINPKAPAIVYVGTWGGGVIKSTDGGGNWVSTNLKSPYIYSLVMDPATPTTLYVSTSSIFKNTGGVFKSTDGGESWNAANTGLTGDLISVLTIDPLTPTTLYAAVAFTGVFKSTDSGDSWIPDKVAQLGFYLNALAIDPKSPNILYAGPESNAGVYVIHQ
jgi:hypothetical protein